MAKLISMLGETYGLLTVVARVTPSYDPAHQHLHVWECICECGNYKNAMRRQLRAGVITSCGMCVERKTRARSPETMNEAQRKYFTPKGQHRTRPYLYRIERTRDGQLFFNFEIDTVVKRQLARENKTWKTKKTISKEPLMRPPQPPRKEPPSPRSQSAPATSLR